MKWNITGWQEWNRPLARNEIAGWQEMKLLAGRNEIACGKEWIGCGKKLNCWLARNEIHFIKFATAFHFINFLG
jgi:hypothetical protein